MTMITTEQNKIITEAPEPDDVRVEATVFGEGDTPGAVCGCKLCHLPIAHYQECLDWAVGIADQMARPIYAVPLNHSDIFNTGRRPPYRNAIAGMNHQQRGGLRHIVVSSMCVAMRDCDDWQLRADAHPDPLLAADGIRLSFGKMGMNDAVTTALIAGATPSVRRMVRAQRRIA